MSHKNIINVYTIIDSKKFNVIKSQQHKSFSKRFFSNDMFIYLKEEHMNYTLQSEKDLKIRFLLKKSFIEKYLYNFILKIKSYNLQELNDNIIGLIENI